MRNSLLHPDGHHARLIGIVVVGAAVFGIGLAVLNWPGFSLRRKTVSRSIPLEIVGGVSESGAVYLMDEQAGLIRLVGTFEVANGSGEMDLRLARNLVSADVPMVALFWPGRAKSYVPHFEFLFNDDLNARLEQVYKAAEADPVVKVAIGRFADSWGNAFSTSFLPEMRRLLEKPELRRELTDAVLMMAVEWVAKRRDLPPDTLTDTDIDSRAAIERLLREHIGGSVETIVREVSRDPAIRQTGDELRKVLEPHLHSAVQQIIWTGLDVATAPGKDGTPNARLLWVARRVMFGSRAPAILLYEAPDGMVLEEDVPFICKVAK